MCQKSCLGCMWADDQSFGGSWDEPPSEEWECLNDSDAAQAHYELGINNAWNAKETAAQCPGYKEAPVVADYEDDADVSLSPDDEEALINAHIEWQHEQAIQMGWVDPETGEPTDEYLALSDLAYDMARGA